MTARPCEKEEREAERLAKEWEETRKATKIPVATTPLGTETPPSPWADLTAEQIHEIFVSMERERKSYEEYMAALSALLECRKKHLTL